MGAKARIWDAVLAAALLLLSLLTFLPKQAQGDTVTISVNGAEAAVLPLRQDSEYNTEWGTVIIRNGGVRFTGSVCPDHLCEHTGEIRRSGQIILCLPNRIAIQISSSEVDAVVG